MEPKPTLPRRGLADETPLLVLQAASELTGCQERHVQHGMRACRMPQLVRHCWIRADYYDRQLELLLDHADRFRQVAVIGNDESLLEVTIDGIGEEPGCEVDIGPLLFGFDYLNCARTSTGRIYEPHPLRIG